MYEYQLGSDDLTPSPEDLDSLADSMRLAKIVGIELDVILPERDRLLVDNLTPKQRRSLGE